MDLTTGYAPFANGGHGVFAYGIRDIRDNRPNSVPAQQITAQAGSSIDMCG